MDLFFSSGADRRAEMPLSVCKEGHATTNRNYPVRRVMPLSVSVGFVLCFWMCFFMQICCSLVRIPGEK